MAVAQKQKEMNKDEWGKKTQAQKRPASEHRAPI